MSHSSHQSGHRVRRSPGQWHKLFDEYCASGLSQKAFCAREGVAYASFCTWRRKLASSTIEAPVAHGLPAFVEVTALDRTVGKWTNARAMLHTIPVRAAERMTFRVFG